jgi:hypothetical protein
MLMPKEKNTGRIEERDDLAMPIKISRWLCCILTSLFIIMMPLTSISQTFNVNLSPKHQRKMSAFQSGHKQMMKYYKYYKQDSIKQRKENDKDAKHNIDSVFRADRKGRRLKNELSKRGIKSEDQQWAYADSINVELKRLNALQKDSTANDSTKEASRKKLASITKDRTIHALSKGILPGTRPYAMAIETKAELQKWWLVMKDTTASDSLRSLAREKVKEIAITHAMKYPQFEGLYDHYKQYGQNPDWNTLAQQVPGLDTLQAAFASSPEQLMETVEKIGTAALVEKAGLGEFSQQAGEVESVKNRIKDLRSPDKLKQQGKEQVTEQSMNAFANEVEKVRAARNTVSKLLGKYREFSNSNDLSDAVKRTSLEGKSFKERIVIGGNFNIVSTDPLSLDLAPLLGYRFNTLFFVGVSANYRHTFKDSLKFKWYVSPSNTSLRIFGNYDIFKNFFVYAEAERSGLKRLVNDNASEKWHNNYFVGGGRKLLLHPKVFMTVTALYNLNNEGNNPNYPRRFQVRLGFQSSDLAFRKKKVHYNP